MSASLHQPGSKPRNTQLSNHRLRIVMIMTMSTAHFSVSTCPYTTKRLIPPTGTIRGSFYQDKFIPVHRQYQTLNIKHIVYSQPFIYSPSHLIALHAMCSIISFLKAPLANRGLGTGCAFLSGPHQTTSPNPATGFHGHTLGTLTPHPDLK
ncbi:hypothetical protein DM02DRAFT_200460 [Periconia macrospinosa]|uniref:Uncharacterized protein n=1 Tax=Periconia macrospinosa TaxID=97972 RepID=A0A2V1D7V4_9PLEO|nr:hypothetical protein DM02DRAFT_200460 [Periconia macrospinosa]